MVLQVAQEVSVESNISSWSRALRGPEFVSRGQPEGGYPLRIPGALVIRSNSAVRATGVELQEIPQGIR